MSLRQNIHRALTSSPLGRWPHQVLGLRPVQIEDAPSPKFGVRLAWARLNNLLAILRSGDKFNAVQLARLTGCCSKTIQRDVRFLREHGVKMVFDRASNSHSLDRNFPLPPMVNIIGDAV